MEKDDPDYLDPKLKSRAFVPLLRINLSDYLDNLSESALEEYLKELKGKVVQSQDNRRQNLAVISANNPVIDDIHDDDDDDVQIIDERPSPKRHSSTPTKLKRIKREKITKTLPKTSLIVSAIKSIHCETSAPKVDTQAIRALNPFSGPKSVVNKVPRNIISMKGKVVSRKKKSVKPSHQAIDPMVQDELDAMSEVGNYDSVFSFGRSLEQPQQSSFSFIKPTAVKLDKPKIDKISEVSGENVNSLWNRLKTPTNTVEEKFRVLDARDKLFQRDRDRHGTQTRKLVGTCPDMCPEKERMRRIYQQQVGTFEMVDHPRNTEVKEEWMVKEYSRSSADQDTPLPHDLRPVAVLKKTMKHLCEKVMNLCEDSDESIEDWYMFLWDRTRAIRKDLTHQDVCDPEAVKLLEMCARFHIHCAERLVDQDLAVYDDKINTENLTKTLQTLKYMYNDLRSIGTSSSNEAEFLCYSLLLNLNNPAIMTEMRDMPEEVLEAPPIRFALDIIAAHAKKNYIRFFRLIRGATYLNCCILRRYFSEMRLHAIKAIVRGFCPGLTTPTINMNPILEALMFESIEDCESHFNLCNLNTAERHGEPIVILDKRAFKPPETPFPIVASWLYIRAKKDILLSDLIWGSPLRIEETMPYTITKSFNSAGIFKIDTIPSYILENSGLKSSDMCLDVDDEDDVFSVNESDENCQIIEKKKDNLFSVIKEPSMFASTVPLFGQKSDIADKPLFSNIVAPKAQTTTSSPFVSSKSIFATSPTQPFAGFGSLQKPVLPNQQPGQGFSFGVFNMKKPDPPSNIVSINALSVESSFKVPDFSSTASTINFGSTPKPLFNIPSFAAPKSSTESIFGKMPDLSSGSKISSSFATVKMPAESSEEEDDDEDDDGDNNLPSPILQFVLPPPPQKFEFNKVNEEAERKRKLEEKAEAERRAKDEEARKLKEEQERVRRDREIALRREEERKREVMRKKADEERAKILAAKKLEEERRIREKEKLANEQRRFEMQKKVEKFKAKYRIWKQKAFIQSWRRKTWLAIESRKMSKYLNQLKVDYPPICDAELLDGNPLGHVIPNILLVKRTKIGGFKPLLAKKRMAAPGPLPSVPLVHVGKLIAPALLDRVQKLYPDPTSPFRSSFPWKLILCVPDEEETDVRLDIFLERHFVDRFDWKFGVEDGPLTTCIDRVGSQNFHICVRRVKGRGLQEGSTTNPKIMTGANSVLFFVTDNLKCIPIARERLKRLREASGAEQVPTVIFVFGSKLSEPVIRGGLNVEDDTRVVICCGSSEQSLVTTLSQGLSSTAQVTGPVSTVRAVTLSSFLISPVLDAVWHRAEIALVNFDILLKSPEHVIKYYNKCVLALADLFLDKSLLSKPQIAPEFEDLFNKLEHPLEIRTPPLWNDRYKCELNDCLQDLSLPPWPSEPLKSTQDLNYRLQLYGKLVTSGDKKARKFLKWRVYQKIQKTLLWKGLDIYCDEDISVVSLRFPWLQVLQEFARSRIEVFLAHKKTELVVMFDKADLDNFCYSSTLVDDLINDSPQEIDLDVDLDSTAPIPENDSILLAYAAAIERETREVEETNKRKRQLSLDDELAEILSNKRPLISPEPNPYTGLKKQLEDLSGAMENVDAALKQRKLELSEMLAEISS